ncbi:aminoglycoside phosphotransferase [Mycolicibacterium rhodesiae JS60]|nr:aminoglycoside phosphotransferase [Mycolicibacterium rhodesiae JS60]
MTVPSPTLTADPSWLTEQLAIGGYIDVGDEVIGVAAEALAFTGATSDMARLRVTYRGEHPRYPKTMIAKIRGRDELRAEMDAALELFAREAFFYEELAKRLPIRTPRAFAVGDGDESALILEDLAGLRAGDQSEGMAVEDAERCVEALADLHSAFWQADILDDPRLMRPQQGVFATTTAQLMASGVPVARTLFASEYSADELNALPEQADAWIALLTQLGDGPKTLIHNDCRADNLFFATDGSPVFVDWQMVAVARASQDLANLLAGSLASSDLSTHWHQLLTRYHIRLGAGGVVDYSFDDLLVHYRQSVLWPLGQGLALLGALSGGDARRVGPCIFRRALDQAIELDTFAAFQR